MLIKDIAKLGKLLGQFLALFAGCFASIKGRRLLDVYVRRWLSDGQRKNTEAIALDQSVRPRTFNDSWGPGFGTREVTRSMPTIDCNRAC